MSNHLSNDIFIKYILQIRSLLSGRGRKNASVETINRKHIETIINSQETSKINDYGMLKRRKNIFTKK